MNEFQCPGCGEWLYGYPFEYCGDCRMSDPYAMIVLTKGTE